MKIYTKTGDDGTTGLVGSDRIRKDDPLIEAIGSVDEANAALGSAIAAGLPSEIHELAAAVQSRLFDIGSELATPKGSRFDNATLAIEDVQALEESIDCQTAALAPLKNFILPGGTEASARLHLARTVSRRAERACFRLDPEPRTVVLQYLNRLSDWLFVAARTCNAEQNVLDIDWKPRRKS